MQGLCHLSRRWHQQFCRSPSFSSHQKCLQRWYFPSPSRLARQRQGTRPSHPSRKATAIRQGDLVVREYEQDDENSPNTRQPIDHSEDLFVREAHYLRAEMQRLDEELEVMKEGPFGPNSKFMQSIPKDEREQMLKELEAEGLQYDTLKDLDLRDDVSLDFNVMKAAPERQDLAVSMRIADSHRPLVVEFNKALLGAQDHPDKPMSHVYFWKCYLRCQQKVPGFSSFVNEDVWQFLWQSQIKTYPKTKHIIVLARDMTVAAVDLDHAQRLDYLDALHATGDTASAIQEWEKEKDTIAEKMGGSDPYTALALLDDELASRFWATGVKLYAAVGRPAKAETIAFKSLEGKQFAREDSQTLSILVDVMKAWTQSQRSDVEVKLWSCYMLMRRKASESAKDATLPTGILGQITSLLLHTGHRQMALAVFRDLLAAHTGNFSEANADSIEMFSKTTSVTAGTAETENIVNQVGLTALLALPKRLKNKFFFGAWIKWLIGQDKVDEAALVVELMQELGVKPDARHLNGIVGAWLRDGSPAAQKRAEEMAWAMIYARIELVKSRNLDQPSPLLPDTGSHNSAQESQPYSPPEPALYTPRQKLPVFLQRNIPPATLETFSVLLLRYTRGIAIDRATQITDIMTGPADIRPNSFILNHWLNLSLRASDLSSMFARYQTTKQDVQPDIETFAILWDGCRRNLDRTHNARTMKYFDPRQLLCEMRACYLSLPAEKKKLALEDFAGQVQEGQNHIYTQIIRCFCLHSDLRGTYVALEQLKTLFGHLPHEDIASMILMQVARMAPTHPLLTSKPRTPARFRGARDQAYRAALGSMANVLQGIVDWKGAKLIESRSNGDKELVGRLANELAGQEHRTQQENRLDAVKTFLLLILKRMKEGKGEGGTVLEEIRVAGTAMGCEVDVDEVKRRLKEAKVFEEM